MSSGYGKMANRERENSDNPIKEIINCTKRYIERSERAVSCMKRGLNTDQVIAAIAMEERFCQADS